MPTSAAAAVSRLAETWSRANPDEDFPRDRLEALHAAGATTAFTAIRPGAETQALFDTLRAIGAADLSLGRIFEGHVNALQLIVAYGAPDVAAQARADAAAGLTFGVWSTEPAPGVTLHPLEDGRVRLEGAKSFATGAGEIERALIPVRRPDGAKQLVLVPLDDSRARADTTGWRVRGMRGTVSGLFDFGGTVLDAEALVGGPGDYEREPRFSAGAWRFCAVQLGAAEALVQLLRDGMVGGRGNEPVGRARFIRVLAAVRGAGVWVARAAQATERGEEDAVALTLMARGLVEEAGLAAMEAVARGLGTASFFENARADRITRDLGLYLRQPDPDGARDRAAIAWLERDRWSAEDRWW